MDERCLVCPRHIADLARPDATPTKEDRGRKPSPAARVLSEGTAVLDDRALMALVLGDRVRATLDELLHADPAELVASRALSPHQAAKLAGALEFCRRLAQRRGERTRLSTASAVWAHVRPTLAGLRREVFRVLCLDARSGLLREAIVAEGSVDSCHVDPREVFAPAIACRASGVVLVHNHPSGDPTPSPEDIAMTRLVAQAAEVVGVALVDHVVVARGRHSSMLDLGVRSY